MKKVLISSFDLEVGGVERSLINMLNNFNYEKNEVDLILYNHKGEFMNYLDKRVNLLEENKKYKTIREPIVDVLKSGHLNLFLGRVKAKYKVKNYIKTEDVEDVRQMQYMWKYSIEYFPHIEKDYDIAISYLWPHYFVAEKVKAKIKVAWIHTDFSKINTDKEEDIKIWEKFNYICAVSEECKRTFLEKYPEFKEKVLVLENITSVEFIKQMTNEKIEEMKNEDEFKILSIARFSYAKGIDNAVLALKKLKDKGYKNIKWYVIGYGGEEDKIKDLIKKNDLEENFILLGKKINPYPYIKACDLYVQPSRYEGKAVTVGEAQILSKPVIITNYSTAKSQVKDMVDGYICSMSIEGLANSIEELYMREDIREKLIQNCKKIDYSNVEEIDKLYKLYI